MKGVTSEVIAEVRSRASILDVVSEVVVLKRGGKDYKGLCPFHNEKTPSFYVNLEKGIYKCFGCGEGGDVFTFVQKTKGVEFIDCVRHLAHKYGVALVETEQDRKEYDKRSFILLLYQQASEYYSRLLKDAKEGAVAREYLTKRGIDQEIIERFKLGYAPSAWDGLMNYLTEANNAAPATLEEAGLIRRKADSNSYFDLFRHRLMIPICDDQGRVIAFGGRTLGDDQVKYINSPETPIYTKGQHLFAFHLAKEAIKKEDSVIVVEGYFDAIAAHQAGFANTVATLGTALGQAQAKLLVRYTESKRVLLAFDADMAGVKAVDRGIETLNQIAEGIGIDLRVIKIPGGKDPDECLRAEGGRELFARAKQEALPLIDYQLEAALQSVNTQTHTGKIEAAKKVVPVLAQIKNTVARGEYARQTALKLGVREEELLSDITQFRKENRIGSQSSQSGTGGGHGSAVGRFTGSSSPQQSVNKHNPSAFARTRAGLIDGTVKAEQCLLALFLTNRENYEHVLTALQEEEFITPQHQSIKEAIQAIGSHFNTMEDLEYKLRDRLAPEREPSAALIEVILQAEVMRKQNEPIEGILSDFRKRLMQERLKLATSELLILSRSCKEEAKQVVLQSKIRELGKLGMLLPSLSQMSEIDAIKRKIKELLELGDEVSTKLPEVEMETMA